MAKRQLYGIKFPINVLSDDKTLFDLNISKSERVRSELMHCIFTPKGQRLRKPEFGTRLIQFIFNPNDSETWGDIINEIKEAVKRWVPDCILNDINIYESENGLTLYAEIKYSVKEDNGELSTHTIKTKI